MPRSTLVSSGLHDCVLVQGTFVTLPLERCWINPVQGVVALWFVEEVEDVLFFCDVDFGFLKVFLATFVIQWPKLLFVIELL